MRLPGTRIVASLASLLVLAACALGAGGSDDERFLDGLRSRGLYELAEKHCADRLANPRITDAQRAMFTIELSRTLAQHALEVSTAEAEPLWLASQKAVEDFVARYPRHPRLILVELQGALAAAARGEAASEEVEGSSDPQATEAARSLLRRAIAELRRLSKRIADELNRRGRADASELSMAQLQSLEMNVRYELARALRSQALAYPPGTADRINSLTQATEALAGLPAGEPHTPLEWSAAIEQITCLRLLGEYPAAERELAKLEKGKPPPEFAEQLRAQRIRLALDRGRVDEALSEAGTSQSPAGGEAELARLEALLAAFRRADRQGHTTAAADWQRRAIEQVRAIERSQSRSWMRKAEARLARALAGAKTPQTAETLAQSAAGYYRSGQMGKAVAAYDEAAKRARDARQPEQAFDFAYTAAAIEQQERHYREALARYLALAAAPKAPKAADAHLLAIYCAAQLAQAESPPKLDEYERLLREHVDAWPDGPTAAQAWNWLGRLAENRHQWQAAVEAFGHVKDSDPQFADAVRAVGQCYAAWLDELHEHGQDGTRLANDALGWFEKVIGSPAKASTPATRAATLAAARTWLQEMPTGALPAERLLRDGLRDPNSPDEWKTAARRLLVTALAAQGKNQEAKEIFAGLPHEKTADLLALLGVLSQVARRADPEVARKLAAIELDIEDDLLNRPGELDAATRRAVTRDRATTLAALGRRKEALEALESLALARPHDGQTQEALAQLLAMSDDDLPAALAKWREVASRSRPGTPRWFRARYELARTQLRLGRPADAQATIDAVAAKYPDFGGAGLKEQFDRLRAKIDEPRGRASGR